MKSPATSAASVLIKPTNAISAVVSVAFVLAPPPSMKYKPAWLPAALFTTRKNSSFAAKLVLPTAVTISLRSS